jgi:hypothetical protein
MFETKTLPPWAWTGIFPPVAPQEEPIPKDAVDGLSRSPIVFAPQQPAFYLRCTGINFLMYTFSAHISGLSSSLIFLCCL